MTDTNHSPEVEIAQACIAVRLRLLNRSVSALFDQALRPHGATVAQLNILVAAARLEAPRPAILARTLALEKSTLSRNLRGMEERGWVRLVAGEDERSQKVLVTTAGRRLIRKVRPDWRRAQEKALQLLGREGVAALSRMARRVSEAF